jgi:hypothetical protein
VELCGARNRHTKVNKKVRERLYEYKGLKLHPSFFLIYMNMGQGRHTQFLGKKKRGMEGCLVGKMQQESMLIFPLGRAATREVFL